MPRLSAFVHSLHFYRVPIALGFGLRVVGFDGLGFIGYGSSLIANSTVSSDYDDSRSGYNRNALNLLFSNS